MFVTSAEDLDQNFLFSSKVKYETFLKDLPEEDTRKKFCIHGGSGTHYASGCYVVLWDNTDPRIVTQTMFVPEAIKRLLLEMQRISKEIEYPRAVNVRDAWSAKKRFVIGSHGRYIKGLEKLDEIIERHKKEGGSGSEHDTGH